MYHSPEILEARLNGTSLVQLAPSDTYAFALVAAEVLTSKIPYEKYLKLANESYPGYLEMFIEAVIRGERPQLEVSPSDPISVLLSECWAHAPDQRPPMHEVVRRIDEIVLADLELLPECAKKLWKETLAPRIERHSLAWYPFIQYLLSALYSLPLHRSEALLSIVNDHSTSGFSSGSNGGFESSPSSPGASGAFLAQEWASVLFYPDQHEHSGQPIVRCVETMEQLKFLVRSLMLTILGVDASFAGASASSTSSHLPLVIFPRFYQFFSTFIEPGTSTLQQIIASFLDLVESGIFFADINASTVDAIMESSHPNTVIIRISSSSSQDIWLSLTVKLSYSEHAHARIYHLPGREYRLYFEGQEYQANSISELLRHAFPNRVHPPSHIRTKFAIRALNGSNKRARDSGYQGLSVPTTPSSSMNVDS